VRVTHARWRARRDERDGVVEVVRRVIAASLSDDPDEARDDLHPSVVVSGAEERLEGREAVLGAWRALGDGAPATAWIDHDLAVEVIGASAIVRYDYELERDEGGTPTRERGHELWVLTHAGDRWLAAYRMTLVVSPGDA
jgi:ketosteroid isomerase-like protein